jgi:hypothetical protein
VRNSDTDADTDSDRNGNTYSNPYSNSDGNTNSCAVRESNGYSLHATRSAVKHHGDRTVIYLD